MPRPTAALYDRAIQARLANTTPPRVDGDTALIIDRWEQAATGHNDDELVIKGIKYGFAIQYRGPPRYGTTAKYNHPSAENYPEHIQDYVTKEVEHAALEGMFTMPPFTPWFYSSPLMSREKGEGGGRRVIVDLSYPDGGINCCIVPHQFDGLPATHNLPTIDSAVATIARTCPGDIHLAVIDLSRAYRQFPVNPLDWPLLGIFWRNKWAFDRRLPFGSRMSSFAMQMVANFIVRALQREQIITHMYLDDILLISPSKHTADRHYKRVIQHLQGLGLQVAVNKLQPPASSVKWLGIKIDVAANLLSIPEGKLSQISKCMATASRRNTITVKHLQRLVGLANHLAKVVRPARIFVCRLLASLRASHTNHVIVTSHIRADLSWFVKYLRGANGRAIIPNGRVVKRIWADACLVGAGASDGEKYYEYTYPEHVTASHHITQLEAINCLAAVRRFVTSHQRGGIIEIFCDNRPTVDALTSGRAKDEVLAACARALWMHAATTETDLAFTHVPGEGMGLPDALSRVALDPNSRVEADRLINKLRLRPVKADHSDFAYKDFC